MRGSRLTGMLCAGLAALGIASGPAKAAGGSAHDFAFEAIEGGALPMSRFAGHPVLVVNTASECGFTKQYAELQELWARYREAGLVVLGVPSNDFGGQEPGSAEQIKEFCEVNFSVDFPLTDKVAVRGDDAHPFYRWAGSQVGTLGQPRWNFHKYLIGADGRLIDWFATTTSPTSDKVVAAVEAALAER